jgi:hypothetical protein
VRDGSRCIVTGGYDCRLPDQSTELEQEVTDSNVETTSTHCEHIFPESIPIVSGIDDKDAKARFADLSSVVINHAYL